MDNYRILLIVDKSFALAASSDLQQGGYAPTVEPNPGWGWQRFLEIEPAMLIFDREFSGKAGIALCRRIRKQNYRTPILMLVNQETIEERVACLESGADDYLLKPYNQERLFDLLSLYLSPAESSKEQLRFGDLILDLATRQVVREEDRIDLTMKEFELLKFLMSNPGKVLTRDEIIENVWGYDFRGESNVIEVYIRYLRLKIEQQQQRRVIQTVRGVGYVLKET